MNNKLEKLYEMSLMKWGFDWLPATPPGTYLESYETFKQKIESDKVFYNQIIDELGVHIQERELSLEERCELGYKYVDPFEWDMLMGGGQEGDEGNCNDYNIPTKLITLTYNNETIEVYEPIR